MNSTTLSRRHLIAGLGAASAFGAMPAWAQGHSIGGHGGGHSVSRRGAAAIRAGFDEVRGEAIDLAVRDGLRIIEGRRSIGRAVNGTVPGPLIRLREGQNVRFNVANHLREDTSIHWHGLLVPFQMDGVPGISFPGIKPDKTFTYDFPVRQAGTYWYHSHSGFQEQAGLYGALIIDAAEPEPFDYQRDHVVLLSDWTDLAPTDLYARLKKMPGHDNYGKRTVGDFLRDAKRDGLGATVEDRKMWGEMRMTPTDLSDVNAHTYTYLINGTTSLGNWTGLFARGEKVRLRFINGSAMTHFDVRIPGLTMTVVAVDGQHVHPVTIEEFRIAAAETFDVIVTPNGQDAFTIFAQDMGRTGYVSGTLAVREGLRAPVPPVDPRPILSMADMGHGGMDGMDHSGMGHSEMNHGSGSDKKMDHSGHDMASMTDMQGDGMQTHPASETGNPLVDMQTMMPTSKLDDPGIGLRDNGRKTLSYSMLRSLFEDPDGRDPGRDIELHLTGHMERFAWSFDGQPFAGAEPLRMNYGERLRIVLVNDTMMTHPIHLHGMWSDLENDKGEFMVRKHTVDMPPGTKRSYRVRADALGHWAYHCHLLYHMEAGMMREVRVEG